jgi:dienelactone hydrolase
MFGKKIWVYLWILMLLSSACQPGVIPDQQISTPTLIPTATNIAMNTPELIEIPTSTWTQQTAIEETLVTAVPPLIETEVELSMIIQEEIEAFEELNIASTIYLPADTATPRPVVLLLHMLWGDKSSWDDFARQLAEAGFVVIAVDMRGHGETGGEIDWEKAAADMHLIWEYLESREGIDEERRAVIGASIGANMALITGAAEQSVNTAVLLSPGLNYAGVTTREALENYGQRPLLIVASEKDAYAADSSRKLEQLALGEAELIMYQGAGHGTHIFSKEPGLSDLIITWLQKHLQ